MKKAVLVVTILIAVTQIVLVAIFPKVMFNHTDATFAPRESTGFKENALVLVMSHAQMDATLILLS